MNKPFSANPQRGNVFAMLFAAVALTGVLASVGMQTLTGPVTTITRVTQKNIADTQLLMNAKIIINAAVAGTAGGDADTDGIIEPATMVSGTGAPTNGGFLPATLGLSMTDPWGSRYGYCVWDHGTTNSSTDRISGDDQATATQQPVIAIIAAGPDKTFQTSCPTITPGTVVSMSRQGDDLLFKYTYAEASVNSNGLWTLNASDQAKAELKDSGGTARVSIDRSTGIGDFLGVTTDTLAAKTDKIAVDGGLKLDTNANVTTCAVGDEGVIRFNTGTGKLEVCNGTVWKAAGSDLWLENGNDIYNGNTGNIGIGTSSPTQKLDVQGNTNISGNTTIGGTGSVTGNFTVNTDAFVVNATNKYIGVGKVPTVALDVVGNAYVTGTGTIVDDLIVDTSALFVDASADAVGIGTATPAYTLDIYAVKTMGAIGSLDVNEAIVQIKEDTSGPSLFMDGNTVVSDAGFITGSVGNFDVSIIANDAEVIRATAGGNVGIGVAVPATKLDVAGSVRVPDGSSLEFGGTDTVITGNSSTDILTFSTAASERMRIADDGNVGIGDTAPAAKLSVAGGLRIGTHTVCAAGGANNGTIRYDSSIKLMQLCVDGNWKSVSSIDKLDDIGDVDAPSPAGNEVLAWDAVNSLWKAMPISSLGPASITVAGNDGSVQFKDGSDLGADPTTFHWDKTNDRLGIGTNAPDTDLHIKRGSGNTTIKMESGSGYGTISHSGSNLDITNSATGGDLNIYTGDELSFWTGTPSTRRLYIDADGNTGIGTATPGALLDVEGGIQLGDDAGACDAAKDGTLRYNTSQLQICVSGTWSPVGSGGSSSGLGTTMVSGWPDALNCGGSGNPSMYYLTYAPFSDSKYYYRNIWHGSDISVLFLADKTYDSKTTADTGCDGKSITQLYAENRAYNFVGGGTAGAGTSMITNVPDAIECGVSGTQRILYLQSTTAATYTYALSGGATAVGMQVVFDALPAGTHNSTTNTAGWTNSNGCDGKSLTQLAGENRTFDLVGGAGSGSGITVAGADGYIQFNTSGALDGESALFWDKTNNYLGIALSGAPVATVDIAGGVKLGTDATCTAGKAGMLVYNAGSLQFCNSSGSFVPVATGSISLANGSTGRVQLSDGSGNFTSDSGLVFSGGKLGVGGSPSSDTLDVTGTLGVSGAATVGGALSAGSTSISGTLTVTSDLTVDGNSLFVDATNNMVGMGTTTPVALLDVAGGIRLGNDSGTCDNTREGTLRFNADNLEICKSTGWGLIQGGGGSGTLWTVNGNDAYSSNTGSIGIGTTSPQATLDVNGGIRLGSVTTCTVGSAGTLRWTGSALEVCNGGTWNGIGGGGGGTGGTQYLGFPDGILCAYTTNDYFWMYIERKFTDGDVRYTWPGSTSYWIRFNANGTYDSQANLAGSPTVNYCVGRTIADLYTNGQAFNFVGGGGTSGGSNQTNMSMISSYPDSIVCTGSAGSVALSFGWKNAAGAATYVNDADFGSTSANTVIRLDFSSATAAGVLTEGTGWTNWGTDCNGQTLAQLYSAGKAFNLAASTAIASGTAGYVQFSGGVNLNSDGNLFWDNTNKRLGIGTASPAANLHVAIPGWSSGHGAPTLKVDSNGDILLNTQGVIFFDNNYSYATGSYIGPYSNTSAAYNANTLKFTTAGAERMRIDASGNMGIGVLAPLTRLHVVGGGVITGADATCNVSKAGMLAWNSNTLQLCTNSGSFVSIATAAGVTAAAAGTNGQIQFNNSGAMGADANLYWDNTNKRLGVGTSSPSYTQDINYNVNAGISSMVQNPNTGSAAYSQSIIGTDGAQMQMILFGTGYVGSFGGQPAADGAYLRTAASPAATHLSVGTGSAAPLYFFTNETTRMTVDTTGNVGIGNTNPGLGLGDGATPRYLRVNNASGQSVLALTTDVTTNGAGMGSISFGTMGTAASDKRGAVISSGLTAASGTNVSGNLDFWTSNAGVFGSPRMRIISTGEIGIGTTTPQALLDVNGGVKIGNTSTCAAGGANNGTLRWTGTSVEVCNNASWMGIGSGGSGGTTASMHLGWPDVIYCKYSTADYMPMYYSYRYADGRVLYVYSAGSGYWIRWNGDGTYADQSNMGTSTGTAGCLSKPISQLYSEGKAFNLAGGVSQIGAGGTNASMFGGLPDAIMCNGSSGYSFFDLETTNTAGGYASYKMRGDDGSTTKPRIDFNITTGAQTNYNNDSGTWENWMTNCNTKTLAQLYSTGQAFNLAAASALASGTAGAVQFSGGANLSSDTSNFFWDNTNKRLGIGTSSPSMPLSVGGAASAGVAGFRGGAYNQVNIAHAGNASWGLLLSNSDGTVNTGYHWSSSGNNNSVALVNVNNDAMHFGTNNASRMVIHHTGTVSIGTNITTVATAQLDVAGGVKMGTDATCTVAKAGMMAWNSNTLQICTNSGSFVSIATASGLLGAAGNTGNIQFNTSSAMTGDNNLFWDNTNKWMGLGTTTPAARLTVNGAQSTTMTNYTQALGSAGILIDTAYTANAYTPGLFWRTTNNNPTMPKAGLYMYETGAGSYLYLGTSNSYGAGITSNVVIDPTGKLGVGTTTPAYPIDVVGNVRATAFLNTSDRRLKDHIETVSGIEIIRKLRGVSFVWKDTGKEALGLIAQEVEEVVPQAVMTDDKGFKSVDYIMMISPMIEAIKSLDVEVVRLTKENTELKARVESLEGTVKSLEERLKALEEKIGATVH